MAKQALAEREPPEVGSAPESEKRRQILDGAREVFLARGFDAASMGDIAAAAGVSKGTLYVYFENKQKLFAALVAEQCRQTAERAFVLDAVDQDARAALIKLGKSFIDGLTRPQHVATIRIVTAVAGKLPELGRIFLDSGPRAGAARLSDWLRAKIALGELKIANVELAAWQFLSLCQGPVLASIILGGEPRPSDARMNEVVTSAVDVFLAAYSRR
jgi:AcrR family transcriptional regulator